MGIIQIVKKGKRIIVWIIVTLIMVGATGDVYGQTRKRSKTKAKTTTVTKKSSSTTKKAANPKTSAEAKKRQAETQKEIQLTEAQIKENEVKVTKGLNELGKLDQEISKTQAGIKELDGKVKQLEKEINSLETSISKNEEELSRLREEYLKAVKKMRVTKKNKSSLAFLFSSKNMSQAMRRMRYLREFSAWRGRQTEEINGKIADLRNEKDALAKAKEDQQSALALQKASEAKLANQHSKQEALVAELKQNGKALESHLKKKKQEATELGNIVSQLIAEEQRKAEEERIAEERRKAEELRRAEEQRKAEEEARKVAQEEMMAKAGEPKTEKAKTKKEDKNKKPTEYADARKRTPRKPTQEEGKGKVKDTGGKAKDEGGKVFADMRGKLPYPTTGSFAVTSRFGRQNLPDLPDVEYDNPGIDAESDAGASARAVFQGKVSGVYLLPGYNTVVIVNHGNYYTVYGNIASPSVKNGDAVESGTTLGTLALNDEDNGHSSIHFEVWKNREKLNPQEWLK